MFSETWMPQLAVVPCFFCWDLGAVPEVCSPATLQVEKRDFVKVTLEAEAVSTPCWLSSPLPHPVRFLEAHMGFKPRFFSIWALKG